MSLSTFWAASGSVMSTVFFGNPRDLARLGRDAGVGQGLGHVADRRPDRR